jgi:tetratricopeptide (TPR) repeat protein
MLRRIVVHGFRWLRRAGKRLATSGTVSWAALGSVATFLFVGYVLVWNFMDKSIVIEQISVPKALADEGYTPTVTAQKLHDAVEDIVVRARSHRNHETVELSAERPDFVVPSVGLSMSAVARGMLTSLHLSAQPSISGDLTSRKGQFQLTIRMNGNVVFGGGAGARSPNPETLIAASARAVLERTSPFFLAASETDPQAARREIDSIIARLPQSDENVREAYNLRGTIFRRMNDSPRARAAYLRCAELYPDYPVPHYNLGNMLLDDHRVSDAIEEYSQAIRLDRSYNKPYNGLGDALKARGQAADAIAAYKIAIRLDPGDPEVHDSLGELLRDLNRLDEAAAELSAASKLDPHDLDIATFNVNYGIVLQKQGHTDDAVAAIRTALAADPAFPGASLRLSRMLTDDVTPSTAPSVAERELGEACSAVRALRRTGWTHNIRAVFNDINAKLHPFKRRCAR